MVARALGGDGSMCGRAIVLRRRQVQVRANGYGFSRAVVYLQFGYRYHRHRAGVPWPVRALAAAPAFERRCIYTV